MKRKTKTIVLVTGAITILFIVMYAIISADRFNDDKINSAPAEEEYTPYKDANLEVEIIPAPNDTYGYNIKMNGRTLIHQPNAPALPGIEGFKTEEDARRVGEFVIHEILNNIFPPRVTAAQLDSLGVL